MTDPEDSENDDKRLSTRTPFNAKVKISHPVAGEFFYHTRDISDTGIFVVVNLENDFPGLGSMVKVQMQGLPIPAPVLDMVVVRRGMDGYGLHFTRDKDDTEEDL